MAFSWSEIREKHGRRRGKKVSDRLARPLTALVIPQFCSQGNVAVGFQGDIDISPQLNTCIFRSFLLGQFAV